jgi:hypothetical protein
MDKGLKVHSDCFKDVVFKNLATSKEQEPCCAQNLASFFLLEKFESVKALFMDSLQRSKCNAL